MSFKLGFQNLTIAITNKFTKLQVLYGHGESAAAFWPVPLVSESQLSDPDDDYCDVKAALNGLMQKGVAFRVGPTTEMVPRRWHQTPQHHHNISIRRLKNNHPPDILFEELHNMSRLRHPGKDFFFYKCQFLGS